MVGPGDAGSDLSAALGRACPLVRGSMGGGSDGSSGSGDGSEGGLWEALQATAHTCPAADRPLEHRDEPSQH